MPHPMTFAYKYYVGDDECAQIKADFPESSLGEASRKQTLNPFSCKRS